VSGSHNCQKSHLPDVIERAYFVGARKDLLGYGLFNAVEIQGLAVVCLSPGAGDDFAYSSQKG
jgi:hypothetical protein